MKTAFLSLLLAVAGTAGASIGLAEDIDASQPVSTTGANSTEASVGSYDVAYHGHHNGHYDVYYYAWNGQYWALIRYGEYHSQAQAQQAVNYLYWLGYKSAFWQFHCQ